MIPANLNFIKNLDLDLNVEEKLSRNLMRVEHGSDDIYITPIAKEHGTESLFSKFNEVFEANKHKLNEPLLNLEVSNRDKFGPRSISMPWKERKQSLTDSFGVGKHEGLIGLSPLKGKSILRPLSINKANDLLKNDTSSGLPYYTKKGIVKERVLDKFDSLLNRKDPCVLFTRTQEQGKTRNVWGYPMADTLNEMRFYSPLLSYQKELPYRAAINTPDVVSRAMTELILKSVDAKDVLVSVDFSKYDNTVKSQAQMLAFNYIKSLFQKNYSSELDYISDRFRNISIVTPDGVMTGDHGVPSGSTFTNEVDSIVQATIATSLPFVNENDFQIQGDDGVYRVPQDKVTTLMNKFRSCGLSINEDKSLTAPDHALFLQCLFHIDYIKNGVIGGIYPIYRALNRLIYQERWSDFEDYNISGKDYYSIRTICIVENCKYHPLFRELVKFVLTYDKYSLSVTDKGIASYVQMIRRTKGAGEILNHQYGDDVRGIRAFETFRLVNELS